MNGVFLGIISAVLFGASTPASKLLLGHLTPIQLAGFLYLGAALGVLPLIYWERGRKAWVPRDQNNRNRLAGAILLGGVVGPILLLMGLQMATAGAVSLMLNLEMAATAVLGVLLFREPLHRIGWLGVLGIVGAGMLLSFDGGWPGMVAGLLVALACVCWGLDNHLTALIDGITPAHSTLWKGSVAGVANLAIGVGLAPLHASWSTVVAALIVGALSYGVSIVLYIASAQQLGATRAQGLYMGAPFLGAGIAFLVLGESFGGLHLVGTVLLVVSVGGLFLSQHGHEHRHGPIEHVHSHRHDDDHHCHESPDRSPTTRHSHWHGHEALGHTHPHWPDLHHRHPH